ncbi:MAG: hypothetical protein DRN15_05470 [Thermoprotei archaeon]|nr:MAG: hypothetical protein DRN15_05470 [Thermoprotei archaeon]
MNSSRVLTIVLLGMLITAILATSMAGVIAQEAPRGPYLDEVIYKEEPDTSKAIRLIDKGELHLQLWYTTKAEDIKFIEESPRVGMIPGYGGVFNLFLNPLFTDPEKYGFNPFSIKKVREALNYLIDREYIVKEILHGYGIPQVTVFRPMTPDYAREVDFMMSMETKYKYNPDLGKSMIFEALYEAGCEYKEGKWYYKGKPIKVKIFIRIEDERKTIGEYVASILEDLGFEVEKIYGDAYKAWLTVYGGDPRTGEWHAYTEGWAFTAISAYEDDLPEFMYVSPWSGAVFEYYKPSPVLVDLAEKLTGAEYKSLEERSEWVRKLTELCLADSTRIWLVVQSLVFPVSADLENIVYDLVGGPYSLFTIRALKFKGRIGGSIIVGNRRMFISAWNPIGGEKWLYDTLVTRQIVDPALWPHPHTGRYIPVRVKFKVVTKGPEGKLPVPEDALKFDPKTLDWVPVGPGVNATSAVEMEFIYGKWHHGAEMDIADIMISISELFRLLNPEDPIYDEASVGPTGRAFVEKFKGIKILADNKAVVYVDYWHPDETYIASFGVVWATIPWEVVALMNEAVKNRELAFSDTRAGEWGVEWLDLSKGPSLDILKKYLDKLKAENYIPKEISKWVTPEEAKARWEALTKWYEEIGHFYVSNGPFYIAKVDPAAKMCVIKAFREYIFTADAWNELVKVKKPEIGLPAPPTVVPGLEAKIAVSSTFEGAPYDKVDIVGLVVDPATGLAVIKALAEHVGPGRFEIALSSEDTAKLKPGIYKLTVVAIGREASIPVIKSIDLTVMPETLYFEKTARELEMTLRGEISALRTELEGRIEELGSAVEGVKGTLNTAMMLAGVALLVGIIGIAVGAIAAARAGKK